MFPKEVSSGVDDFMTKVGAVFRLGVTINAGSAALDINFGQALVSSSDTVNHRGFLSESIARIQLGLPNPTTLLQLDEMAYEESANHETSALKSIAIQIISILFKHPGMTLSSLAYYFPSISLEMLRSILESLIDSNVICGRLLKSRRLLGPFERKPANALSNIQSSYRLNIKYLN